MTTLITEAPKVTLLSNKVTEESFEKPVDWLFQKYINKKLFSDNEKVQRLLIDWKGYKINSYLTTLLNGMPKKDSFILADISKIVESIKSDMAKNTDTALDEYFEFNLKYFSDLENEGYEYLIIDGQHRIDTIFKYFDNQIDFKPKTSIEYGIEGESGKVKVAGKFQSLAVPPVMQKLLDTMIRVVIYSTGDLQELVNVFVTSNSQKAMTHHEIRIINFNKNNQFIVRLCKSTTNIMNMFKCMKNMTSDYSLDCKGDTLFACEMLLWTHTNDYEHQTDTLDTAFGPVLVDKKDYYPLYIQPTTRNLTEKIFRKMGDICKQYPGLKNKFARASFYNLYMTLAFFMQPTNKFGKEKGIAGNYEVINDKLFAKWFFDEENKRLNAVGHKMTFSKPNGKTGEQLHPLSFKAHQNDQKHQSKKSVKGDGGSKYTFNDYARIRYLLEDLCQMLDEFQTKKILQKLGSRSGLTRAEAAVAHDIPLSETEGKHLDEILPVSKGGNRTVENTQFVDAGLNMRDSNSIK